MVESIIALSLLIVAVILIRAIFKKNVSARLVYALWLAVIIRLCIPFDLINVVIPVPEVSEIVSLITDAEDTVGQEDISAVVPSDPISSSPSSSPSLSPSQSPEATVTPSLPDNNIGAVSSIPEVDAKGENDIPENVATDVQSYDLEDIIAFIWLCGSSITLCAFAVPSGIAAIKIRKNRRYHSTAGKVKVYVSDRVASPCVMGIVPTIYITPYAEENKDLSLIILHEKTHIRHGDHIWALLRIILLIIFWWNPFIWAAALLSKRDAEVACDESVVKSMNEQDKLTYSRLIVDMIPQNGGFVVAFSNSPIKYRILRLTGKYKATLVAAVAVTVTIVLTGLLAFVSNGADNEQNALIHIHNFNNDATCTTAKTCDCGETSGKALGHKWRSATCTEPKTCKRCSLTDGLPLDHTWVDATCTTAKTCSVCKIKEGDHLEHIFVDATCTAPKYCSLCHSTEGSALGHSYADATCTSPKTCTRCQLTEGNALGHSYYLGVCSRCSTIDTAFYENIRSQFYSPYDGYSKKSATKTLTNLGYNSDEAEFILSTLNINWYEQALIAARFYTSERSSYTEENFRSNMVYLGFTEDQIDYAIKIAMEEDPPIFFDYTIYIDFGEPDPGTWDFYDPWDYWTGNGFGGYNGEPIRLFDP